MNFFCIAQAHSQNYKNLTATLKYCVIFTGCMNAGKLIAKNSVFMFSGEIASRILSFVFIIALAHILGDVELGRYSFAFAFASLFLIFSDLGLSAFMVKEIAKNKSIAQDYLSNIFSLKLVLLLLFSGAMLATVLIAAKSAETVLIVSIVMIAMLFNFLTQPFRDIFLAFERHQYFAFLTVFERLIATIAGLIVLFATQNLVYTVWVFVASYGISFFLGAAMVWKRFTHFHFAFNLSIWIDLVKRSWPFWISMLFMTVPNSWYFLGVSVLRVINS